MKLVHPEYKILAMSNNNEFDYSYDNYEKLIEKAARLCYKSEDKITENSHIEFLEKLKNKGHWSVFEHSWLVKKAPIFHLGQVNFLKLSKFLNVYIDYNIEKLQKNGYHTAKKKDNSQIYIAGNWRAWNETDDFMNMINLRGFKDIKENEYENLPDKMKYMTVYFKIDRGISHELVRHRPASYSQQSTRYVNYKNKDIEFIIPPWFKDEEDYKRNKETFEIFLKSCRDSEEYYNVLIKNGMRPEQARAVLPNSLATEIIMSATFDEWKHVFDLRTSKSAHPQIQEIMKPLKVKFFSLTNGQ